MAPFHNKGWPYFDKMLEIMPNTTARGGNAFSAMLMAPPLPFTPTADLEGHNTGPPEVDAQKVDVAMDIDQEESISLVSSSPTTKCKIAAITPDDQSSVVLSKGSLATSPTVSMPTMSSEPVRKKHTKSTPITAHTNFLLSCNIGHYGKGNRSRLTLLQRCSTHTMTCRNQFVQIPYLLLLHGFKS